MTLGELALLFLAGLGAGVVGSTAGLASLISYPALLLVGLPPVTANVTNTLGLIGSSIGSVAGSRPELSGLASVVRRRVPLAVIGGLLGATLLLVGSASTFERIVPILIAAASILMLVGPRLREASLRRRARREESEGPVATHPDGGPWVSALVFACCVYGGYFGAAAGVMILALLLARTERSLPVSNALKNLLLGVANATAAVVFALSAPVRWIAVPPLFLGCVLGGWLGPAVVRRVPADLLRWVIAVAGFGLAIRLALTA